MIDPATATAAASVGAEAAKTAAGAAPGALSTIEAIIPDKIQKDRKQRLALMKQGLAAGLGEKTQVFKRMKGDVAASMAAGLGSIAGKVRGIGGGTPEAQEERRRLRREEHQKALAAESDIRQKEVTDIEKTGKEAVALEETIAEHKAAKTKQAIAGVGKMFGASVPETTVEDVGAARKEQLAYEKASMKPDAAAVKAKTESLPRLPS